MVEFACGIPHLMKGEYTEGAGPGIDIYSMRQPLGVVAGITPFNFPAMIPMWKFAPAIACGNAFILKPSERDPGVPMRLAELMMEAGLPAGILNVVNGDKEAVDAILDDPDVLAVGFVGSTPIAEYVYSRARRRKASAVLRQRQEPHDHYARRRHGSGCRRAHRRRLRLGRRALHGGLGRRAGRQGHRRRPADKLVPRVESLKVGPSTDPSADFGPLVTKAHLDKVRPYVDLGVPEGAKLVVDGRDFRCRATRTASTSAAAC